MPSLTYHKNSPYYLIRYYDKFEPDPKHRRKTVSTKIEITDSDKERIENKAPGDQIKLRGNKLVNEKLKKFTQALAERDMQMKIGVRFKQRLLLSEGLEEFRRERSIPGHPDAVKPKTLENYDWAVNTFLKITKDKEIDSYTKEADYYKLLEYFEENSFAGHSRVMISAKLKTLWKYFIEKGYAYQQPFMVPKVESSQTKPIPMKHMNIILNYFKERNVRHYQFVKILLLTGMRPSSLVVQEKEWIDFEAGIMTIRNVKARKKRKMFGFPLYKELRELLLEMDLGSGGRIFSEFTYNKEKSNYTDVLKFWPRAMSQLTLGDKPKLPSKYIMKQIRPTFASYALTELNLSAHEVKTLLDHEKLATTDQYYLHANIKKIGDKLNKTDFEK